jgi:hypothetical protein
MKIFENTGTENDKYTSLVMTVNTENIWQNGPLKRWRRTTHCMASQARRLRLEKSLIWSTNSVPLEVQYSGHEEPELDPCEVDVTLVR